MSLVAVLATACAVGGCDLVAGDSLVMTAAASDPAASRTAITSTSEVDGIALRGIAGIAPCDYRRLAAGDFDRWRPTRVSLAFAGNNGTTPCTRDARGSALTGDALLQRYRTDLIALVQYFNARGAAVLLSAPICVRPGLTTMLGHPRLRTMERELAASLARQRYRVAYSEYAAGRICPGWIYQPSYRTADGVHLSPTGAKVYATALRHEIRTTRLP